MLKKFTFTELRIKYVEVVNFVEDFAAEKNISINTQIEADIGLSGLDANDFLDLYQQKFEVNLDDFEYDKYFYELGFEWYELPFALILSFLVLVQILIIGVIYIFYKPILKEMKDFNLMKLAYKIKGIKKEELTVGDLIVSAIEKKFVPKNQFKFEQIRIKNNR